MDKELHQLGLPKGHSNAICKVYAKVQLELESFLKQPLQNDTLKWDVKKEEDGKTVLFVLNGSKTR